jgi:hypothetical protein
MLDGMTDQKPKRKPAGAAVPGAVDRPVRYPHTLVFLVSDETKAALEKEKKRSGLSKGEVARDWLERGRLSAG